MKGLMTSLLLMLGLVSFSQDAACGQVPRGDVEVKAALDVDLKSAVEKEFGKQFKTTEVKGLFKVFVDCKGRVYKCVYQKGTFLSAEVNKLIDLVQTTKWEPAYIGQESVNSIVFIKIELEQGKASTTIQ